MPILRGALALAALAAVSTVRAQGVILIDDFMGGYHKATIVGEGNKDNLATGLDRSHVFAGHRHTNFEVNGNPFGYTTTLEVGLGEARVVTPGPNDLSTSLAISYGASIFEPMDLDLSAYTSPGRILEIDLATDPPNLFAETWQVILRDGAGRSVGNDRFGIREGGIEFARGSFFGNPAFDWSDVDDFEFLQRWNRTNTAPLEYWTTEIRVVPEPGTVAGLALSLVATAGLRKRRRARPSATCRR